MSICPLIVWNVNHDNREVAGIPNVLRFFLPQNFAIQLHLVPMLQNGTRDWNERQKMLMVNIALGSLKYSNEWMVEYPIQSITPQGW
jgi:hypothetical protein